MADDINRNQLRHITTRKPFMCCNCCHVKYGTVVLGAVELTVTVFLLLASAKRIIDRKEKEEICINQECGVEDDTGMDKSLLLAGEYVGVCLLCLWVFAIGCLMSGIFFRRPELLIPHLLLQGVTLIFSTVYFFLYAWEYFYVDLHKKGEKFEWTEGIERMWLVVIYLIIASFEVYAFCVVLSCLRYLRSRHEEIVNGQRSRIRRGRFYTV